MNQSIQKGIKNVFFLERRSHVIGYLRLDEFLKSLPMDIFNHKIVIRTDYFFLTFWRYTFSIWSRNDINEIINIFEEPLPSCLVVILDESYMFRKYLKIFGINRDIFE